MNKTALALSLTCLVLLAAAPARAAGELTRGVRMKISAGDLASAEAMVEDHARTAGKDGEYLAALAWLGRGALVLGLDEKALAFAKEVRAAIPAPSEDNLTALGAAIEVEGRLLAKRRNAREAAAFFESQRQLSQDPAFQSRLSKNVNLLTLVGKKAPEIAATEVIGLAGGGEWKGLAGYQGKPVVLFLWAHWCGDCKAQAATLAKIRQRYEKRGVVFIAPTRYYGTAKEGVTATAAEEKAHLESVLAESYQDLGPLPVPISTEAMIRYGGSSTPTFVTIDRQGIVRSYDPTRLTEAELAARIEKLLN